MSQFYTSIKLSDKISKTPEGFLVCHDVAITKVGELVYLPTEVPTVTKGNNNFITVERTNDDVFDPETIQSFNGKPLTILHPKTFVTPKNWKSTGVGSLQNVRKGVGDQEGKLVSDIVIYDEAAIKKVEDKELREVSCGYDAEYVELAPGRARQTKIRGNHLALVPRGRAGPECAIFDSAPEESPMNLKQKIAAAFTKALDSMPDEGEEETMDSLKKKVADLQKKLDESAAKSADKTKDEALEKVTADLATASAKVDELTKTSDGLKAELEKLKAAPQKVTHDAAVVANAEILSPGIDKTLPDLKVQAIKTASATDAGKAVLKTLIGDAQPVYDNAAVVDVLFNGMAAGMAAGNKGRLLPNKQAAQAQDGAGDFYTQFADAAAKVHSITKF
jgi:hypothetical protein